MKRYCLGFFFSDDLRRVLLIRKTHGPKGVAGKFNGIGGEVRDDETMVQGMERTFRKETGLCCNAKRWERYCTIYGGSGSSAHTIGVYVAAGAEWQDAESQTEEDVDDFAIEDLDSSQYFAPGACWMAHMALGRLRGNEWLCHYHCTR